MYNNCRGEIKKLMVDLLFELPNLLVPKTFEGNVTFLEYL